jgi:general secretion pathway protein I
MARTLAEAGQTFTLVASGRRVSNERGRVIRPSVAAASGHHEASLSGRVIQTSGVAASGHHEASLSGRVIHASGIDASDHHEASLSGRVIQTSGVAASGHHATHHLSPGSRMGRALGSRSKHRDADQGFTLLEVLVAFIIAAIAVAALMRAGGSGLAATHAASRYQEALSHAQSHLASAVHGAALVPADNQGDDGGGFHWRVRVTPSESAALRPVGQAPATSGSITLFAVSVWVSWPENGIVRTVRLDTAQIGTGAR